MKRFIPARPAPLPALLLALSLAGCFGGEDGGTAAPVAPEDTAKTAKKIAPGIYVGDYAAHSDSDFTLESEFTLGADGAFRFYWIADNEAFGDLKGSWFQKDSNLHFTGMSEAYLDRNAGLFIPAVSMEDDTNSVREVTDTSFIRKEWTPLRQKPYWISYRKKSFPGVKTGNYQFSREIQLDSVTNLTVRIKIELDGDGFLYRYSEDSVEFFQVKAVWYQQGSILGTEQNEARNYDTTTREFSPWEPITGALLQRISEVSDTAFRIWSPPSFFQDGTWEVYHKVP